MRQLGRRSNATAHKDLLERFPELTRHAAVDGKVDRVADDQGKVHEQDAYVDQAVVQELDDHGRHDMQGRDHGQRDLDHEEDGHHDDQHESGTVGVAQLLALLLAVLAEQLFAPILRPLHGSEQETVERDQADARHQVHEEDAERVVRGVVQVLAHVLVDPGGRLHVAHLRPRVPPIYRI